MQVSKHLSKEQIDSVFAKFDKNSDGKLSKEEFQKLMVSYSFLQLSNNHVLQGKK